MVAGTGFAQVDQLFSSMDVPCMDHKTYARYHEKVCNAWEDTAIKSMNEAAEEEAKLAVENGQVDQFGNPMITVVCDGSWAKRSYRKNYNSLSGTAAIIGQRTKKLLFLGVRNKFCTICKRAENSKETVKSHKCYKNWAGSASSMETNILTEGFCRSMDMYGIIYNRMIADGDSSVFKNILDTRPYEHITVQKIECRNHLLRNFCNKLEEICNNTKNGPISLRKLLRGKFLKMRISVVKAMQFRKSENKTTAEKIISLKGDILNLPSHVFGEHCKCHDLNYFCQKQSPDEENFIMEFKNNGMYEKIMDPVRYLAHHAPSLLENVDNNIVEQFNAIVAKFTGGKRINFALKRSYQSRCYAAALSHNTKMPIYTIQKHLQGTSPSSIVKRIEKRKLRILQRYKEGVSETRKRKRAKRKLKFNVLNNGNEDYGFNCRKPDMNENEFEEAKKIFFESLPNIVEERISLERRTTSQGSNEEWLDIRRKLITASNFGKICRRLEYTPCRATVENLLYGHMINPPASIRYGRYNEKNAIDRISQLHNVAIELCGLFIDAEFPYMGATPDGIINDGIVEENVHFLPEI